MENLIERLKELAEYAEPREWDLPLDLADVLRAAAEELEVFRWYSASTPPPDSRSVHICHGRPDFKTVCIGYYDHTNKTWYEERNWFARILPDALFWVPLPDLPGEGE